MAIAAQVNKRTTISTAIVSSSTNFTLTSGVFDTFSDDYLVVDYDNPSLLEVIRCSVSGSTVTVIARGQSGTSAQDHSIGAKVAWNLVKEHIDGLPALPDTSYYNLLKNGNFHNNSTNGYGNTPDDWTNSSANPVQGGFPSFTKQQCIDLLGVTTGQIQGLWNLNGNFNDLSDSAYTLTANGSPADSSDGLMAQAKDFELGTTDYATKTTPTNLLIASSQTWFAWVKPESIPGTEMDIAAHADSTPTVYGQIAVNATAGTVLFKLIGLTTNTSVSSDIALQAGKWYFVCGVYDATAQTLSVWVNGIKKSVTASGTHTTSGTQAFSIGRAGANNGGYFDGLIQNAGVLSVALSDDQVKRLWSFTSYKGQKIRRAGGSDGTLSQDLPQNLVERLRGKTVTFAAEMYQDTASIGQISINSGSETASSVSATTGSWVTVSCTQTISSTATAITLYLKVSTSNGNVWFKEGRLHVGSSQLPYAPSADDWERFPLLLQQNPGTTNGYTNTGNVLGYVQVTSNQASIGSEADLTGLAVTVNVPTGARIKITAAAIFENSNTGNETTFNIKEGATLLNYYPITLASASRGYRLHFSHILVPSAGVHTYKLTASCSSNTTQMDASATFPAFLLVEVV